MSKLKKHILIVEDDIGIQNQLKWCFNDFEVHTAGSRDEALDLVRKHFPSVVLLDLGLPPDPGGATEGLATLEGIHAIARDTKVIIITGNDERKTAVDAIGIGAYDYYQKPIDKEVITHVVDRAHNVYRLEQENRLLQRVDNDTRLEGVIATSPQMLQVCSDVEKVAPSDTSTLILGESGTGKELLARALHNLSKRSEHSLIAINCAAIPKDLLESELFGYEKGAFTGAAKQTQGKIEFAHHGTLFLDEIGDMPLELQGKLLRFLQERVIERVGGRKQIPVDVRIISATHKDLSQLIEAGLFREDLFYRISEIKLQIPALRERDGDILMLARVFLERFTTELGKPARRFSGAALDALEQHDWPGNIREMENLIKRAVIMSEGNMIGPADLELETSADENATLELKAVRDRAEFSAILQALQRTDNNVSKTAKLLGVTRPTLYDLMDKHGLRPAK